MHNNNFKNIERRNYYEYNKNNNNASFNSLRVKKMDELYNLPRDNRKQPIIYTQPQSKSNTMRNKMINQNNENYDINNLSDTNNRNDKDNISVQNDENEIIGNNNNNQNNSIDNNYLGDNNNSINNNNYLNNNFEQENNNKNYLNKENNNNNLNLNKSNYDYNENKYERFRPRSINHAMNILLDKE